MGRSYTDSAGSGSRYAAGTARTRSVAPCHRPELQTPGAARQKWWPGGTGLRPDACARKQPGQLRRSPSSTNSRRIECGNAGRLVRISCRSCLPLQQALCAVQFANGIDVSDKTVAGSQGPIELDLLGGTRAANANPAVLSKALEQLDALSQH